MITYYNVAEDKTVIVGEKGVVLHRFELEKRGYIPIVSFNAPWDAIGGDNITRIWNNPLATAWKNETPLTMESEIKILKRQIKNLMEKQNA